MHIQFWGVRGSVPVPGPATVRYGGNTSCVSARVGDRWVVFDAGTGLRLLGLDMFRHTPPYTVDLFLTHVHWDHIQGFPFFGPAHHKQTHLTVHGFQRQDHDLSQILAGQMEGPNFPVSLDQLAARLEFKELREGTILPLYDQKQVPSGSITNARLNHPNGVVAYRLVEASTGASVVYATDTEHYEGRVDDALVQLAKGADVLIYDGMYTPEEYPSHRGWGHSTWLEGFKVARAAQVAKLVVFHHDPSHDDEFMDHFQSDVFAQAAVLDPTIEVLFAREGMTLDLRGGGA